MNCDNVYEYQDGSNFIVLSEIALIMSANSVVAIKKNKVLTNKLFVT